MRRDGISFLVTRYEFLWASRVYGRHSPKLASLRHRLGAVTNAALITKFLLSSLQNDMPPLRRYIGQKFPCAMRLLGSSRQMFSTNMGGSMISTVLYLQVPSVCCRLAAEDVMTTCCSEAKRQRQRGLQVCFVQRAFLASQTKPYVKRTSNAACMMVRCHKKFMIFSDAQVQTHWQT